MCWEIFGWLQGVRRMCVFSVNRRKNTWGDLGKFDHFTFKGE